MSKIKITAHAFERAKERLSLSSDSLKKMADKAYDQGIKHSDTKGALNKYLSSLFFRHKNANNIRIYGEFVYIFINNKLVTLYVIPSEYKKHIKIFKEKKNLVSTL